MANQFKKALKHTLTFEGGYAFDPADSGGETFRGISRRNWPNWPGWPLIDHVKTRGATTAKLINAAFEGNPEMERLVSDFYRQNFWQPFDRLKAPGRVMAKLFDTAVNVGIGGAVKMLQRAINKMGPISPLQVDGALGPCTEAKFPLALAERGEDAILAMFCKEQEAHYRGIVSRKPSQQKFLNGWLRRAAWIPE